MNGKGIAQIIVLWALLLLGSLAGSFAYGMRTEALASRNGLDGARAYYQARTGINHALILLSTLPPDNVVRRDISGEEEDSSYKVIVESESGKFDINVIQEALLKELLRKGGLSEDEADSVGDSILDWRDDDDRPRPRGAEESEYASLPEPIRPRNGKLAAMDELLSVRGVTHGFYRSFLAKVFTVHGITAQVNINAAPPAVLRALPGFTPELADAVVARRTESPFLTPTDVAVFLTSQGVPPSALHLLTTASASNVYSVLSRGRSGDRVVRYVRCVVSGGSSAGGEVKMVRWEDNVPSDEAER